MIILYFITIVNWTTSIYLFIYRPLLKVLSYENAAY